MITKKSDEEILEIMFNEYPNVVGFDNQEIQGFSKAYRTAEAELLPLIERMDKAHIERQIEVANLKLEIERLEAELNDKDWCPPQANKEYYIPITYSEDDMWEAHIVPFMSKLDFIEWLKQYKKKGKL